LKKRKLVVANWKMNKGLDESRKFAAELKSYAEKNKGLKSDVIICPPFTSLVVVHKEISGSVIKLGAQNVHQKKKGAYTGEISTSMLISCGCEYVIIGHSERRQLFHENDVLLNEKVHHALDSGLNVILCVGETLQEHDDQITDGVIEEQVTVCLRNVDEMKMDSLTIAYEPVWAIGTGKNATPRYAESVHNFIRKKIKKLYSENISEKLKILYGGSITPANAKELFEPETVNGGLVGGASLEVKSFLEIINHTH